MAKSMRDLIKENVQLIHEKNDLVNKLKEANEVIEAIKKGNIDAVFIANSDTARVLVSTTADLAYRKFIENMSEGVVTLHTDRIILYSNSSFAKIVDLPLEKVIGANFSHITPIEFVEIFERFFNDYPQNNSKVQVSILNHGGRRTHFIVSVNALPLQDFVALNLVWTDVTDLKEAKKKLVTVNESLNRVIEESIVSEKKVVVLNNKLKENIKILKDRNVELATFAHIASHDLQEPLRKIITYSSIIKNDYYSIIDERGHDYIDKMQRASMRMRHLINDILEYSQLSQKNLFQPTNLQSIVYGILSDLEVVIQETGANIIIGKELPVIDAISSQMRQLFQNIISNALKFIKADVIPEITITYEIMQGKEIKKIDERMSDDFFCIIYIKDNGIGFDPEYITKMFTIFQRLNNNSVYPGTGIGLAICKRIVERHSGFITAESKMNEGALFTITLPVHQPISRDDDQNKDADPNEYQKYSS